MKIHKAVSTLVQNAARLLPIFFVYVVLGLYLILPPKTYSKEEQRYLMQWPMLQSENILDGNYRAKIEQYFSDQFPFREFWIQMSQLSIK